MDLEPLLRAHPAVRSVELVGSRGRGDPHELSDWDYAVAASDFEAVARDLPRVVAPLEPLAEQWDRLSPKWCWMLIVPGPAKIDLIFTEEPHTDEPPWEPNRDNLGAIDAHFWDWMLWLRSKLERGKHDVIASELERLFQHLLGPLGATAPPSSIAAAIELYRAARAAQEQRLGVTVDRKLETAAAPAFSGVP